MRSFFTMVILCFSMSLLYCQSQSSFVHFESDSHTLDEATQNHLSNLLLSLEEHSDFQIEVIGHTDQDGSDDYNEKLAERRASSVSEYLVSLGVSENKLIRNSRGERELITTEASHQAKQKNRRVELKYKYTDYDSVEEMITELEGSSAQQTHMISTAEAQLIDLKGGTTVYVPKGAFVNKDGEPIEGPVELEIIEAFTLTDFVAHNLYTESKGNLIETGGMLYVNATVDGEQVQLAENRNLELIYPVSQIKENMEVFYGEETDDGEMTWVTSEVPITSSQIKNDPVMIDLDPILNYDMGRVERPQVYFQPMPQRPRLKDKPFPPAKTLYSEKKYNSMYANYEKNLEDWKKQLPKYLAAEEAWQEVVSERLEMIKEYKEKLLEMEVRIKVLTAMNGVRQMEGRRAPVEMLQSMFSFMKKPMRIVIDERKIHKAALGNYTRDVISERKLKFNLEGHEMLPKDEFCRDLRLMIYNALQLAREKRYRETGKIDSRGFGSYVAKISNLGWINCDRFIEQRESNKLFVNEAEKGTKHYLIYKDISSIISGRMLDEDKVTFNSAQLGESVKLVAMKLVDEKPYMAVKDFVIGRNQSITMDFHPCGLNDIKAELNSVDPTLKPRSSVTNNEALSLNIFPNPTTDAFTAEVSQEENMIGLAIYDIKGSMVKNIDYNNRDQNNSVSVSDFESGTYVVTARFSDGRLSSEQLVISDR